MWENANFSAGRQDVVLGTRCGLRSRKGLVCVSLLCLKGIWCKSCFVVFSCGGAFYVVHELFEGPSSMGP